MSERSSAMRRLHWRLNFVLRLGRDVLRLASAQNEGAGEYEEDRHNLWAIEDAVKHVAAALPIAPELREKDRDACANESNSGDIAGLTAHWKPDDEQDGKREES